MANMGFKHFTGIVRGKAVTLQNLFGIVIWEVVDLCKEYVNEIESFLCLIVVMDDEDGRCLLDVIW